MTLRLLPQTQQPVIPASGFGFLLLIAGLLPGYAFLRAEERRSPRPERSPLVETVELAGVGLFATLISGGLVALLGLLPGNGFVDVKGWLSEGSAYLRNFPYQTVASGSLTLVFSLFLASKILPAVIHRKVAATLRPGMNAWHQVLGSSRDIPKFVDVELNDGRVFSGTARAYSVDLPMNERELVLTRPIFVQETTSSPRVQIHGEFIVLRGDIMRSMGVTYIANTP